MAKKILAFALCLLLAAAPAALASTGDATLFARLEDSSPTARVTCVHDGALYIVGDNDLYTYRIGEAAPVPAAEITGHGYIVSETGEYEIDEDVPISPNWFLSEGGRLYGFHDESGYFGAVEIGEVAVLKNPVRIDLDDLFDGAFPYFYNAILDGDSLYLSIDSEDYYRHRVYVADAKTGALAEVEGADNLAMSGYGPGKLLLLCSDGYASKARLIAFTPADGDAELLYEFPDADAQPRGLAYDAESGNIYWVLNGMLCAYRPGGEPVEVNYLPTQNISDGNAVVLPGGYYACGSYDGVFVRNVDPTQKARRALTVQGYSDNHNFINRFTAANPDVPVALLESPSLDVVTPMLNGASDVDIYGISVDSEAYYSMRERGYLFDLSDSEVIRETVANMPENIAGLLTRDGRTLAVPYDVSGECWVYYPNVLEALGLDERDLPGDWLEFLRFIEDWPRTYGAEHPELSVFGGSMRQGGGIQYAILSSFFANYLSDYAISGQPVEFDTPEFRAALEIIARSDYRQYEFDEAQSEAYQNAMVESMGDDVETGLFESGWDDLTLQAWGDFGGARPLALALAADKSPVFTGNLRVLFVNPHSKNTDLAVRFIESFCENMHPVLKLNLSATYNEPYENPYYRESLEFAQKGVEEAEALLQTVAEESRPYVEDYLQEQRQYLEEVEKGRYIIDEAQIADYRARQGQICFENIRALGEQGYVELATETLRYLEGEQDIDQLIANLDQTAHMIRMEGY